MTVTSEPEGPPTPASEGPPLLEVAPASEGLPSPEATPDSAEATLASDGPPPLEVVEYTDPLCPWAWGSEPAFRRLRAALPGRVHWRRAYAILFDDDEDDPPPDPAAETSWYASHLAEIGTHTLAPRAHRLTRVAASSWPSSLAARAAEAQGPEIAERVLRRLRESVFVLGEPADTEALALRSVRGVPGLDPDRLARDAASADVRESVRADRAEARRPVPEVFSVREESPHPGAAKETPGGDVRYALPTLLFRTPAAYRVVPGWRPYEAYAAAVDALSPGLSREAAPLTPAAALERYRSLTGPERLVLTRGAWPPPHAVRVDTAQGPVWLHPDDAQHHPAVRE
ncbi:MULTISPECIES: DsbA family oxidoreductase [unclassified Streptomyces]|uniref:DsbA family oxidoreductase n=1 Tax=unclassified Streptomyces TaxID=2593676 RepID=UPI00081E1732|nr:MULTISPECIES: DsbA family protein [unclassified Streptomyces]SCE04970.1 Predicted dithiol-disulfide isomerase, DsbA family [Streptomyces sp. ScaeMP-e83]